MTEKNRTYTWSKNPVNGRDILTMHVSVGDMPFGVWRDMGRLAGKSYDNLAGHCVYEFLLPNKREEAKRILDGGMWKDRVKTIRAAAAELAERVSKGEDYAQVEVNVMIKHGIPDEDFNRVLEVYATEMVDDDG